MQKIPPPIFVLLSVAAEWALSRFMPGIVLNTPAVRWVGYGCIALWILLAVSALGLFASQKTTIIPHATPKKLIVSGPYTFTRNPMYLSLVILLIGTALLFGGLTALIVPPIFALLIGSAYIPMEEANMTREFGDEYEAYRRRVRRWV